LLAPAEFFLQFRRCVVKRLHRFENVCRGPVSRRLAAHQNW
jgi:hypothetical protein